MRIRRLAWAGLEIEADGTTVVVDLVQHPNELFGIRDPRVELPVPADGSVDAALVTHLHPDHAGVPALERALKPGAPVFRPAAFDDVLTGPVERELAASGLAADVVGEWERRELGPFRITAVPAVDGLGSPQVSWVVEAGGKRVLHGGDTLFHGAWWAIARRCGPFDAVFLPINGPVVDDPALQPPSPFPAALTPRQAAVAASILGARTAVPIHHDDEYLIKPAGYAAEVDAPVAEFRRHAAELARVMDVGEWQDFESELAA
ncbi:MBL fold metallo-hydrolase [Saccharopolyspora gloriosae]|uniref:L-ascorbate metabolism protein UlaG (Beta-lactamase superfamily) n=1 Tax=Saccharopolyspora gloriosae TaxID=455344 RepID=A0A840NJX2_9PSEU|nr:MBL fold metallo-hydrolase [Saccharopolyspora gloriosae]MBB5071361.1 L-ascorbate metabolism protein UlaG (beta-lactamase superfamily) [Saccharopolyspora gloriosae]